MNFNRLFELDYARAICIILVVIGHFLPDNSPEWYLVFRQWIYSFHMPVFFFISGYLYSYFSSSNVEYLPFIRKKVFRLLVPYLFTSLILIGLKLVIQSEASVKSPVSLFSLVRMFYYPEAGYFLWFVWSLFSIFLIIPFFKTRLSRFILLITAIIVHYLLVLSGNSGLENHFVTDLFCIDKTMVMIIWFMSGVIGAQYRNNLSISFVWKLFIVLAFVGVSVWFCYAPAFDEQTLPAAILPYLGIVSILLISDYLSKHSSWCEPLFMSLSRASFFIYLCHTTVLGVANAIYSKISLFSSFHFIFELIFVVSMGVFIPMILYYSLVYICPSIKKYI